MEAVVAVLGTLAGALVTGLLQHRAAARSRRAARAEQERSARLAAVTELARTVSAHRAAMWALKDAELSGAARERIEALRDASHATRGEVTAPAVMLRLLITAPAVRQAADVAVKTTYGMRDAADCADLEVRRKAALDAHDAFVDAAAVAAG